MADPVMGTLKSADTSLRDKIRKGRAIRSEVCAKSL